VYERRGLFRTRTRSSLNLIPLLHAYVRASIVEVSHAPISVGLLFSMTLLRGAAWAAAADRRRGRHGVPVLRRALRVHRGRVQGHRQRRAPRSGCHATDPPVARRWGPPPTHASPMSGSQHNCRLFCPWTHLSHLYNISCSSFTADCFVSGCRNHFQRNCQLFVPGIAGSHHA
jgi:hypothetical protein